MCSPKLLLISGGVGFVLSFLISKIAGVGTGTAFVRGICFFFGFGGAVFIGYILVSKFIPELLADTNEDTFNNEESDGVDVVVGDNDSSSTTERSTQNMSSDSLKNSLNDGITDEDGTTYSSKNNLNFDDKVDNLSNSSGSSSSLSDIITEESLGKNLSTDSSIKNDEFKPGIPSRLVSSEEQNLGFENNPSSSAEKNNSTLEELPDISNFDVGSVADVVASAENMQSISDVSSPISDVHMEEYKTDADTINMAKAIQTILSKDR